MSQRDGGVSLAKPGSDLIAMSRLLTLLLVVVVVFAHGSSVAAAICRHAGEAEHIAAVRSGDSGISAAAIGEETAGKAASKQSAPADKSSASSPSDMLPAAKLALPFRVEDALERSPPDVRILVGASPPPLLEPPSA